MRHQVLTIINGHVVDEVSCSSFIDEDELVKEKLGIYKIGLLQSSGVDAGVYIMRGSKMNADDFEVDENWQPPIEDRFW